MIPGTGGMGANTLVAMSRGRKNRRTRIARRSNQLRKTGRLSIWRDGEMVPLRGSRRGESMLVGSGSSTAYLVGKNRYQVL